MYKGIIELESLNETSVLKNMIMVREHKEDHPEATAKIWHVYKVEVPDEKIKSITERISKAIKLDWYAVFWNEYEVYAVFFGKVFKVSRKAAQSCEYDEVKNYGVSHGVQEKFIDLQKEIDSW